MAICAFPMTLRACVGRILGFKHVGTFATARQFVNPPFDAPQVCMQRGAAMAQAGIRDRFEERLRSRKQWWAILDDRQISKLRTGIQSRDRSLRRSTTIRACHHGPHGQGSLPATASSCCQENREM